MSGLPDRIVLATRNAGKLREFEALLAGLPVRLLTPADFPGVPDVDEDRPTFEGNALKKAEALVAATGLAAMADDSGLEVDALQGAPGVFSARYAGPDARSDDNISKLLEALRAVPAAARTARFRTVIAWLEPGSPPRFFEGICNGVIRFERAGTGGFGYDPVFQPDGYDVTFAEMTPDRKNAISHRSRATAEFVAYLKSRG